MATIAIGDVHGNDAALADLLEQLRREVREDDVVVFLGDYIDRGPGSKACVDAILALQRDLGAEVVCLCGNHEDWFMETSRDYRRHSWLLAMDAFVTIESYSPDAAAVIRAAAADAGPALYQERCALPYDVFFNAMPPDHLRFFETLRTSYRSPDCLCSHGGLDPRVPAFEDQSRRALLWGARGFPQAYDGAETIVYGHWNDAVLDADGWPSPAIAGRTVGLDTIAHGVLTAIRLPDRRVWQSARSMDAFPA